MPTIFSHALVGFAAAHAVIPRDRPHPRLLVVASLLPIVPDIDGLFAGWIPHDGAWGHRGMTHSLCFALGLALVGSLLARPREGVLGGKWWGLVLFLWAVTASHGLLDALTDGGEGIALLAPFDLTRYLAPWRPIPVAPMTPAGLVSAYGFTVLAWESAVLWPFALAAMAGKRMPGARGKMLACVLCATGLFALGWRTFA